ncbi:MAG: hypothetical protein HYS35_03340 [Betaproteobacteria bacterium]|nr:hypothetical protein [Betaproteobacteria bacterium]
MDLYRSTDEWVVAYLEWIDGEMAQDAMEERKAFVERRRGDRRIYRADAAREIVVRICPPH